MKTRKEVAEKIANDSPGVWNAQILSERIEQALNTSYKDGMMRGAEIAEKIYSDCSNGTPSFPGKHKVAVDVAQAIRKEAQGE